MNSLFALRRMPVLGLNSEYRLKAAAAQEPNESKCFTTTEGALKNKTAFSILTVAGCLPGVSLVVGVFRLYLVYTVYQDSFEYAEEKQERSESDQYSQEQREVAAAWLQDRQWNLIEMGALGVAEICQLSIILAAVHLVKTIFDHAVAAYYQPPVQSQQCTDFQDSLFREVSSGSDSD